MRLLGARRAIGLGLGQRPPDAWVLVCQGLTDHGRVLSAEDRGVRAIPISAVASGCLERGNVDCKGTNFLFGEPAAGTDVTHFQPSNVAEPAESSVHFVEAFSRNGMRFTVLDEGPADAETVVLLHGFPQSAQSWRAVSRPLLAAGYRVIAPDQRGYTPQARPRSRRAYRLGRALAGRVAPLGAPRRR